MEALIDRDVKSSDELLQMLDKNQMIEKLAEDRDNSVRLIIDNEYKIAKKHIRNNRGN